MGDTLTELDFPRSAIAHPLDQLQAKIPARGLLVAEGEEPDWEARFPSGFVPLPT